MKPTRLILYILLAMPLAWQSCKKEKPEPPAPTPSTPAPTTGNITLHFESVADGSPLLLNTHQYINANNDTFIITKFDYYVSNIKLISTTGSVFAETESYHLLKSSNPASLEFDLSNIPVGNYSHIQLTLGIDSARNVSGAQTGALDPANGMFWSWSSGYIMAKVEGTSPQAPMGLSFHIGGFSGANNVVKTLTLPFPINANIDGVTVPEVHLKSNVMEWFTTPTTIDFGTTNMIHMPGAEANTIADNYADMMHVDHVHQ